MVAEVTNVYWASHAASSSSMANTACLKIDIYSAICLPAYETINLMHLTMSRQFDRHREVGQFEFNTTRCTSEAHHVVPRYRFLMFRCLS